VVAPSATSSAGPPTTGSAPSTFVSELAQTFRRQLGRALGCRIEADATSLAFVDHYLSLARDERRPEILTLLAAGAGAHFAQVVAKELGAHVLDDRKDPRRIRVLLVHRCCHFSPVDLAYAAILGEALTPAEERHPAGRALDLAFHLSQAAEDGVSEAAWVEARLAELPPVPQDEYFGLTCRIETLSLICQLLAARDRADGRPPRTYTVTDYAEILAHSA